MSSIEKVKCHQCRWWVYLCEDRGECRKADIVAVDDKMMAMWPQTVSDWFCHWAQPERRHG